MMVKPNERNKMEKLPNCYAFIVQTKGYYMIVINMIFLFSDLIVCVCFCVYDAYTYMRWTSMYMWLNRRMNGSFIERLFSIPCGVRRSITAQLSLWFASHSPSNMGNHTHRQTDRENEIFFGENR